MENNNEEKGFQYTYSAKEQEELKRIRDKYTTGSKEEDKMTRLRRLDRAVTQKAEAVSLIFGVIGTLMLGFGMSLCMTELGKIFESAALSMTVGIIVGLLGVALVTLAYPMYNLIVKRERKKIAPEIIRLSDELMQ